MTEYKIPLDDEGKVDYPKIVEDINIEGNLMDVPMIECLVAQAYGVDALKALVAHARKEALDE
jgi:hypothetical protein